MNHLLKAVALLLILASFSSCGVIFGGSRVTSTFVAQDHPEAEIYVDGRKLGRGTATGSFRRNRMITVELRSDQCNDHFQTFDYDFRTGNFILSVVTFGILGLAVDLATGAAYKPAHRFYPNIDKYSDKVYVYRIDYPNCPATNFSEL